MKTPSFMGFVVIFFISLIISQVVQTFVLLPLSSRAPRVAIVRKCLGQMLSSQDNNESGLPLAHPDTRRESDPSSICRKIIQHMLDDLRARLNHGFQTNPNLTLLDSDDQSPPIRFKDGFDKVAEVASQLEENTPIGIPYRDGIGSEASSSSNQRLSGDLIPGKRVVKTEQGDTAGFPFSDDKEGSKGLIQPQPRSDVSKRASIWNPVGATDGFWQRITRGNTARSDVTGQSDTRPFQDDQHLHSLLNQKKDRLLTYLRYLNKEFATRDFDADENGEDDNEATEMTPSKRAEEPWMKMIRLVVNKRPHSLSINNAMHVLADMLHADQRDRVMKNRQNLRYHMYVQG